jgi:hypothetical protein
MVVGAQIRQSLPFEHILQLVGHGFAYESRPVDASTVVKALRDWASLGKVPSASCAKQLEVPLSEYAWLEEVIEVKSHSANSPSKLTFFTLERAIIIAESTQADHSLRVSI